MIWSIYQLSRKSASAVKEFNTQYLLNWWTPCANLMNGDASLQIKHLSQQVVDVYIQKSILGVESNQNSRTAVAVDEKKY